MSLVQLPIVFDGEFVYDISGVAACLVNQFFSVISL